MSKTLIERARVFWRRLANTQHAELAEKDVEIERLTRQNDQLRAGIERVIALDADSSWLKAWYETMVQPKAKGGGE